jgi:hypothetical protein
MPDRQKHRGAHPSDRAFFSEKYWPALKNAVTDVSWLLSRGYTEKSAVKLAGDRYFLKERQRKAVMRCVCSDESLDARRSSKSPSGLLSGKKLFIDGFNLLITIEAALSGGLILEGRDGCYRDIASVHGSYRKMEETQAAIRLTGGFLQKNGVEQVHWVLDKPVSNSGRLSQLMYEMAAENNWPWSVELLYSPDHFLKTSGETVASSDGVVLDEVESWVNLARELIDAEIPGAWVVRLI